MRGSLRRWRVKDDNTGKYVERDKHGLAKGEHSYDIILALGRKDGKYKQRWVRFHGTRKQAEDKLKELTGKHDRGKLIEPSKQTCAEYFDEWMAVSVKPCLAANTYALYTSVIKKHFKPAFGHVLLQQLNVRHIDRYYADLKVSSASKLIHNRILSAALNSAVRKKVLAENVNRDATKPPKSRRKDAQHNVWDIQQAQQFLRVVKQELDAQVIALFALALDSGARKSELLGLRWSDLNNKQLSIEQQVLKGGNEPVFIPPKREGSRSLELSPTTVALITQHKRRQLEVKMANRLRYRDLGLMFARTTVSEDGAEPGTPLPLSWVRDHMERLCTLASVKRITIHGMRHTSATLLLAAGVPPNVVQKRLGHSQITMTLGLYAHALPEMDRDAASRLATLLHGA